MSNNPYHPNFPPDNPAQFYGRADAAAFLRQHLVGRHHEQMLVILGRRGMGKTALLHQTAYLVDERYITVYLSLGDVERLSVYELLKAFTEQIVVAMERVEASTYRLPELPPQDTPSANLMQWFQGEFLDVALTAIRRDRFLLLLIDDFAHVLDAIRDKTLPAHIIEYLADLLHQWERLDIVAAIDIAREDDIAAYAALSNVSLHWRLTHLSISDATALITEPITDAYRYTDEMVQRLLVACGGFPFLLHSTLRLLYRYYERNQVTVVADSVLEQVYSAVKEEAGVLMYPLWDGLPAHHADFLRAFGTLRTENALPISLGDLKASVRKQLPNINDTQLASILRSLEYIELLKTNADGLYDFATGIEADWLADNTATTSSTVGGFRLPNRTQLVGVLAIVALLMGLVFVINRSGESSQNDAAPVDNAPPTTTLEIDFDATRSAVIQMTQTAQAAPTQTQTLSPTPTQELSETPEPTAVP